MDVVLEWGLGAIEAVQAAGSGPLTAIMSALTLFGDKYFFFAVLPFLFWCLDERKAIRIAFVSFISAFVNSWIKDLLAVPRPYVLRPGINRGLKALEGVFPDSLSIAHLPAGSLPSGHSQSSLTLWGMLAPWIRKPWGLALAAAVPLTVGFTRVYLGLHYPTDVLLGWAISGVILLAYFLFGEKMEAFLGKANLRIQVAIAALVSWVFVALHRSDVSAAAGIFGMAIGYAFMRSKVRFDASSGSKPRKCLRYLLGMAVVAAFYLGLKILFPKEGAPNYALFAFLRYALVSAWVSLGAPAVFVALGLATRRRPSGESPSPGPASSGQAG